MKFLIQTYGGQVTHDFSFTLIEALKYNNWYTNGTDFQAIFTDDEKPEFIEGVIPCGSVEFVTDYIGEAYGKHILPRNIPPELMGEEFTLRKVFNGGYENIVGQKFVKSNDRIKLFTEIVTGYESVPVGNYQISDLIDIESEWRGFVYRNTLVGLQNYGGDFTKFPNVETIHKMIGAFKSSPVAYTLDVGVNDQGTFIIEVHDFFSCGLYGFAELRILPFMFARWFQEYIKN